MSTCERIDAHKYTEEILLYPDPIIRKKCTAPPCLLCTSEIFPFDTEWDLFAIAWGLQMQMQMQMQMILVPVYMGICDGDV